MEPASSPFQLRTKTLDPRKFVDPRNTLTGESRAQVSLRALDTLWFNTGTLCNLTCLTCYIESSPRNDALVYLSAAEVRAYLDEIRSLGLKTREIGFTGGEPFMNPDIAAMIDASLSRGHECLVLTNAMRPMARRRDDLMLLKARHGAERLCLRVSLDHHSHSLHEAERGEGSWAPAIEGLSWLAENGFRIALAGRRAPGETDSDARAGYRRLLDELRIDLPVEDATRLVLFPDMDPNADVPEITESCWSKLGKSPDSVMCSSSRMVVKRKGVERPVVAACTLTPYDSRFELGATLGEALGAVALNHPYCASFCVLGGASCSAG